MRTEKDLKAETIHHLKTYAIILNGANCKDAPEAIQQDKLRLVAQLTTLISQLEISMGDYE